MSKYQTSSSILLFQPGINVMQPFHVDMLFVLSGPLSCFVLCQLLRSTKIALLYRLSYANTKVTTKLKVIKDQGFSLYGQPNWI